MDTPEHGGCGAALRGAVDEFGRKPQGQEEEL